ncbi:MAG: tRNA lysidine(34) synthetase TilS [Rickettsiaceae bacterium]
MQYKHVFLSKNIQDAFCNYMDYLVDSATKSVALAVSGGSDSVALLNLSLYWAKQRGVKLVVFSVNHNLRLESKQEIALVQQQCQILGLEFYEFEWNNNASKVALQARAREARYQLMTQKCHQLAIDTMLTGHHIDDMLETYLMRKRKKSGVFGLSYSSSFFYNNIQILRPLIKFHKVDLITYLTKHNISWLDDQSNKLDIYERNRVRQQIATFSRLEREQLFSEMQAVNQTANDLNQLLIRTMAESVCINNYGCAVIDLSNFRSVIVDIQIQILSYILTVVSGAITLPRFRSIKKILEIIHENTICVKHTLHGCVLREHNSKLLVFRERSQINNIQYNNYNNLIWDNRFALQLVDIKPSYYISTLTLAEYQDLKGDINLQRLQKFSPQHHKAILFTLPIVKKLEKIIAIPHISYYDNMEFNKALQVVFKPKFVSRFTHFL